MINTDLLNISIFGIVIVSMLCMNEAKSLHYSGSRGCKHGGRLFLVLLIVFE